MTDSKQACFVRIAAPIFQEEGNGFLPLVTQCENSLFEENFLQKNASRIREEGKRRG